MAHQWSSPAPITALVAGHRYSSLHHERSYLLSALAAEESRAEHINRTLETIMAKLEIAEAHQDPADAVGNLRKAAAATSRRLKKCRKNEQAMANSLAEATARMQMLEQHQWRNAQFDYSQRVQQMQIYGMAQGPQESVSWEPSIPPACGYHSMPYLPTSCPLSPTMYTVPPTPTTPALQPPPMITSVDSPWHTPIPELPLETSAPFNTPQNSMPTTWLTTIDDQSVPFVAASSGPTIRRTRRMSLPNPPRRSSWHMSSEVLIGIGEELVPRGWGVELERKLSMVDHTSAALRMKNTVG